MSSAIKILYAEDDETLAFLTKDNLEQHAYEVTHCNNGHECLERFKRESFDFCILDIMLPKTDGFEVAKEIRKLNTEIPIVFLSAKILKEDRIKGLQLGADDYLIKPFSIEELVLKIEIFLRRSKKQLANDPTILKIGNFQFDPTNYSLLHGTNIIKLTQRESELLKLLLENKNKILKREVILSQLWGHNDYFMGRSLDVFISRLRKVFSNDPHISIDNIHRIGFKLKITE